MKLLSEYKVTFIANDFLDELKRYLVKVLFLTHITLVLSRFYVVVSKKWLIFVFRIMVSFYLIISLKIMLKCRMYYYR